MLKTHSSTKILLTLIALNLCAIGCHRSYYRRQADAEAQRLVAEKTMDPRWAIPDGSIEIDPQSRMFDPFSKDHPPIPDDDAASHQFMYQVDGKNGYPHWHANGDTRHIDNPEWMSYLPMDEQGRVVIDMQRAYQLALLHSTELQREREALFSSALNVSLERFDFDTQLGNVLTSSAQFLPSPARSLSLGQSSLLDRSFATGANFAVGLANSILWNFSGGTSATVNSNINFTLLQPLLRNAGRDVVLESLTQAERSLLANVRDLDRFYRGFYLDILTPGGRGGFLGLLQEQQNIRIQEFGLRQQENILAQFREFFELDRIDSLNLKQTENSVYGAQQSLLASKIRYKDSLDNYKIALGLPPDLEVVIDDPFLDQFEFIGDTMTDQTTLLNALRNTTGEQLIKIGELLPTDAQLVTDPDSGARVLPPDFEWSQEFNEQIDDLVEGLKPYMKQIQTVLEEALSDNLDELNRDIDELDRVRPDRIEYLERLKEKIANSEALQDIEPRILEANSIARSETVPDKEGNPIPGLRELLQTSANKLKEFEAEFSRLQEQVDGFAAARPVIEDQDLYEFISERFLREIPRQLTDLSDIILEMSLLQVKARSNSITVPEIDIAPESAIRIARCFRRDWMNERASLVDQWRQIEVVADQLEAGLDLDLRGSFDNRGDGLFDFRGEDGTMTLGLSFDSPLNRVAERNFYRNALISYQQARRNFYQFEDGIKRNLRTTLRNVDLNKILFEVNRKQIEISIEEVELARFSLQEPVRPGSGRQAPGGETSRNLTQSIDRLQNAQLRLLGVWVDYEVLRRGLDFDLGTMQLDPQGYWIDPGPINAAIGLRAAKSLGIELDCRFCDGLEKLASQVDEMDRLIDQPMNGVEPTPAPRTDPTQPTGDAEQDLPAPVAEPPSSARDTRFRLKRPDREAHRENRALDSPPRLFRKLGARQLQDGKIPETSPESTSSIQLVSYLEPLESLDGSENQAIKVTQARLNRSHTANSPAKAGFNPITAGVNRAAKIQPTAQLLAEKTEKTEPMVLNGVSGIESRWNPIENIGVNQPGRTSDPSSYQ